MSNATTTVQTLEPAKRILRTVIALVLAIASVVPYIIGQTHFSSQEITGILTQLGAVATAVSAFGASPAGNYVFGLIGLDAATVEKTKADVASVATDSEVAIQAGIEGGTTVAQDTTNVWSDIRDNGALGTTPAPTPAPEPAPAPAPALAEPVAPASEPAAPSEVAPPEAS